MTPTSAAPKTILHPGMLHTQQDLDRMLVYVDSGLQPWLAGADRLTRNRHSQSTWRPNPKAVVVRGGAGENYVTLYNDVHAAYQNALRWHVFGDSAHGDAARDILNAWSGTLTTIAGNADRFLAAGIYGYQFANAAELMRGYPGFDLARFQKMMLTVFYPVNDSFLRDHNGAFISNYWASWDQLTMASILAIGILCDDQQKIDQAVTYFKFGAGQGSIRNAVPVVFDDGTAEWLEAGRDQGHANLGLGLTAAICEMAWNQGIDLYGYDDNRFMKAAEYLAKYNLGNDVPYAPFRYHAGAPGKWSGWHNYTAASPADRGNIRPIWAMLYNHYGVRRGFEVPYISEYVVKVGVEGGGGDYGPNSGGFDQLGFGTLAFTL